MATYVDTDGTEWLVEERPTMTGTPLKVWWKKEPPPPVLMVADTEPDDWRSRLIAQILGPGSRIRKSLGPLLWFLR